MTSSRRIATIVIQGTGWSVSRLEHIAQSAKWDFEAVHPVTGEVARGELYSDGEVILADRSEGTDEINYIAAIFS